MRSGEARPGGGCGARSQHEEAGQGGVWGRLISCHVGSVADPVASALWLKGEPARLEPPPASLLTRARPVTRAPGKEL